MKKTSGTAKVTRHGGTGFGKPTIVASWRDLGREGPGRNKADSPWTRNGIYIQSGMKLSETTKESGPGLSISRRKRKENPMLKTRHKFLRNGLGLCLLCNLLPEGHVRLQGSLKARKKGVSSVVLSS